jgi:ribosomal protein S18 acetylase RimI-like enzyme
MQVGPVSPEQHESLIELLCELHAYYNEGAMVDPDVVRRHLTGNLLDPKSGLRLIVAFNQAQYILGFAAISLTYSLVEPAPDRRRQCGLKELFVRDSYRNLGTGKALMEWVARYAVENDCCRIDWSVKASNVRGMAFYERLGAKRVEDRLSYRLDGPGLGILARGGGEG